MAQPEFTVSHISRHHLQRFFSKVKLDYANPIHGVPCWIWTGMDDGSSGYGYFKWKNENVRTHRLIFAWAVHSLPFGTKDGELDHLCRVLRCCNPAHLEFVTHEENMRRRFELRTHCIKGHLLTPENLLLHPTDRICKTCSTERVRQFALRSPDRHKEISKRAQQTWFQKMLANPERRAEYNRRQRERHAAKKLKEL